MAGEINGVVDVGTGASGRVHADIKGRARNAVVRTQAQTAGSAGEVNIAAVASAAAGGERIHIKDVGSRPQFQFRHQPASPRADGDGSGGDGIGNRRLDEVVGHGGARWRSGIAVERSQVQPAVGSQMGGKVVKAANKVHLPREISQRTNLPPLGKPLSRGAPAGVLPT